MTKHFLIVLLFSVLSLAGFGQRDMFEAVNKNDTTALINYLKTYKSLVNTTEEGFTPLHFAARNGYTAIARILLNNGANINELGNATDGHYTPLMLALHNEQIGVVCLLLQRGAKRDYINEKNVSAETQLRESKNKWIQNVLIDPIATGIKYEGFEAMYDKRFDDGKNLINRYGLAAVDNYPDGWNMIHYAARSGKQEFLDFLLKKGADINARNDKGSTALVIAAINNHIKLCAFLVKAGADLTIKDNEGRNATTWAKELGSDNLVEILVDPDKGLINYEKNLALFDAVRGDNVKATESVLNAGADIEASGDFHSTPLSESIVNKSYNVFKYLLKKGANPNKAFGHPDFRETPLTYAAKYNLNDYIFGLLKYKADSLLTTPGGKKAIEKAREGKFYWSEKILMDTAYNYNWIVDYLITNNKPIDTAYLKTNFKKGGNLNFVNENGNTLLHMAVKQRNIPLIKYFIKAGADTTIKNNYNYKAADWMGNKYMKMYFNNPPLAEKYARLFNAVTRNDSVMVDSLLSDGLDENIVDEKDLPLLQQAIGAHANKVVNFLLEVGIDPSYKLGYYGASPLEYAASNHNYEAFLTLIEYGGKVERYKIQETSPWIAGYYKNPDSTLNDYNNYKILWNAATDGDTSKLTKEYLKTVDVNRENPEGYAALHLAAKNGRLDLVKLLFRNEVKINAPTRNELMTPIMLAAENKHKDVVEYLLYQDVDISVMKNKNDQNFKRFVRDDKEISAMVAVYEEIYLQKTYSELMFKSAREGDIKLITLYESLLKDIEMVDGFKQTLLYTAVVWNQEEVIDWLLKKNASVNHASGKDLNTPLMGAAIYGRLNTVKKLIEHGADKTLKNNSGETAEMLASKNKHLLLGDFLGGNEKAALNLEMINAVEAKDIDKALELLDKGADVNARSLDSLSFTAMHFAARGNLLDFTEKLIKAGANVNAVAVGAEQPVTPIMIAALNRNFRIADLLLTNGADFNWKNDRDSSALTIAKLKSPEIYMLFQNPEKARLNYNKQRLLIELITKQDIPELDKALNSGYDPNVKDDSGSTPLHYAVNKGSEEIVKKLIAKGAKVNINTAAYTPLMLAVLNFNYDMVALLLEHNASPILKNKQDSSALDLAIARKEIPLVKLLKGDKSIRLQLLLENAILKKDVKLFNELFDPAMDINQLSQGGSTLLHYAAREGVEEIVKRLLAMNANVDPVNNQGKTPLMLAAINGRWKIIHLLLANHANAELEDNEKFKAWELAKINNYKLYADLFFNPDSVYNNLMMIEAVKNNKKEELQELLRKNLNVNFADSKSWTALNYAAQADRYEIVEILLRNGADANYIAPTTTGPHSSLMIASLNNNSAIIKLLLDNHAKKDTVLEGNSALKLAVSQNHYWPQVVLNNPEDGYKRYLLSLALGQAIKNDDVPSIKEAILAGASLDEPVFEEKKPLFYAIYWTSNNAAAYLARITEKLEEETDAGFTPLTAAVNNNNIEAAFQLIAYGAKLNYTGKTGMSAENVAAKKNNPLMIKMLQQPAEFNRQYNMLKLIEKDDLSAIANMIKDGTPLNLDIAGDYPLIHAARKKKTAILQVLLKAGANPSVTDSTGRTAMDYTATLSAADVADIDQKIITKNTRETDSEYDKTSESRAPRINKLFDTEGYKGFRMLAQSGGTAVALSINPLSWYSNYLKDTVAAEKTYLRNEALVNAITANDPQKALTLIRNGADPNFYDARGVSLLSYAIALHRDTLTNLLLDNGARPLAYRANLPLEIAVINSDSTIIDRLIKTGFRLNETGTNGKTLLELTILNGDSLNIQHLLKRGENPNLPNAAGERPLEVFSKSYMPLYVLKNLLNAGADPNLKSLNSERYPLHNASVEEAKVLIAAKANINIQDNNGRTPLHIAINNYSPEMVKLLINSGAKLNITAKYDAKRMTPMMRAVETDQMNVALMLYKAGADLNYKDSLGNSAYSIARAYKNIRMVRFLLDPVKAELDFLLREAIIRKDIKATEELIAKGGDINLQDISGYGPIHNLLKYDNEGIDEMLSLLLKYKVNLNLQNLSGDSPMDIAIKEGLTDVLKLMLEAGANPNTQNAELRRPLELAVTEGKVRETSQLIKAGADVNKKTVSGETVEDIAVRKDNKLMIEVLKGATDPDKVKLFYEWKQLSDKITPVDSTYAEWLYTLKYAMDAAKKEGINKGGDYYNLFESYIYALAYNNYTSEALAAAEEYTQLLKDNEIKGTRLEDSYMLQHVLLKNEGNDKKAIEQIKTVINLIEGKGVEKMKAYQNLADMYKDSLALEYYKLALEQVPNDVISNDIISVKKDYASSLIQNKDSTGIKLLYQIENTINRTKIGEEHLFSIYNKISLYEYEHGSKDQAIVYLDKMIALKSDQYILIGATALALKRYEEAEQYLKMAEKRPINQLRALYHQLVLHMEQRNEAQTVAIALKYSNVLIGQMNQAFKFLSEEEKYNLLKDRKSYFDLIYSAAIQYPNNKEMTGLITNVTLFTKGALIRNTAGLSLVISDNTNPVIADLYKKWRQVKAQLETQYTLKPEARTLDIPFLEEKVREYEKNLYRYSNVKDSAYTWQNVRSTLKPGQAAIEFVTFGLYKDKWTDSTKIIALILTSEKEQPQLVELCYENQLHDAVFKTDAEADASYVNRLYISRGIEREGNGGKESKPVFNLIWKPMEKLLTGKKQLFLSLSGSLHKLSFAALPISKYSLLIDKYDLKYINSAVNINSATKVMQTKDITLFGGIDYNDLLVSNTVTTSGDSILRNRSMNLNTSRGGSWEYLPGTLSETEKIAKLFKDNNWNATLYSGKEATEKRLKGLTGNAPSIMHIATHGYFFPSPEQRNGGEEDRQNVFTAAENPLMRTGLLLAGGNTSWQKGYTTSGTDDGILTAYEVSNLNLQKTDLVVLSACETGLGDIRGSEGVYGLQRAFKIAGADKLIMSLWQVPDKETAELMQSFYSYLITEKDYHKAFNLAQKKMRAKYQPYFWAAFVLVE